MEQVVIIGNGIAGITAARHIRKNSDAAIRVISSESPHFFSRTALMYVYMGHMTFEHTKPYEDWFWKKNRIDLIQDHVTQIDTENKLLQLKSLDPIPYDKLIIATGSKPTFFQWPGQELKGVQGLYHKGDLELLEANAPNAKVCKRAVVGRRWSHWC
jgi:NAD(P)H-nitrite reductase large subunit